MNYDFTYSLRIALEEFVPELTEAQMIYDGVSLTDIEKPFASIEYLGMPTPELLSAGYTSFEETYPFQIGIYAQTIHERHRLESKMRTVLRKPIGHVLYLYDIPTETFSNSGRRFICDVGAFTPLANEDSANETNNNRGYFDVSINILRNTGEPEFTQ